MAGSDTRYCYRDRWSVCGEGGEDYREGQHGSRPRAVAHPALHVHLVAHSGIRGQWHQIPLHAKLG